MATLRNWDRYVGEPVREIGMKTFGASLSLGELQCKFGFDPDHVAAATVQEVNPAVHKIQ